MRGILLARVSMLDAQIWVCKLRHKNILQFAYKDLPEELKNKAILHRARGEGLIIGIGRNDDGRRLWRIADNIKCKEENGKINKDDEQKSENGN